jgi:Gpi18-like mannosyltransferase
MAVYTPPYLYYLFLVASVAPALPSVLATKLPSMVGDFVSAWFAYRLVSIAYPPASLAPVFAAVAVRQSRLPRRRWTRAA